MVTVMPIERAPAEDLAYAGAIVPRECMRLLRILSKIHWRRLADMPLEGVSRLDVRLR